VNTHATAHVLLKDGRSMELQNTISGHRPQVLLANKTVEGETDGSNLVHLVDPNELPVGSKVDFVLKTSGQAGFTRADKVELASEDQTLHATLDISNGLVLQDATTMLGSFDPLKSFGPSAFGKLHLRAIDASGAPGDWLPLGTLVRVPQIASVKCQRAARAAAASAEAAASRAASASDAPQTTQGSGPPPPVNAATTPAPNDPNAECTLNGTSLFLIDSIASDPQFTHSVSVPDGYTNSTLSVPRPATGELYLHLRDDPTVANTIVVPPSASTVSKNTAPAATTRARTGEEDR
jgi:type II secretory pathway pseudopilin PulG